MELIIMCGTEKIYKGYDSLFGELPTVGDLISFDGSHYDRENDTECQQKYKVKEREFRSYETWNQSYGNRKCILYVDKYGII